MTVQVDGLQEEKQSAQHGTKPTVSFVPSGEWGGCRRLLKASSLCCERPWTCQGSSVGEKGAGVLPDAEGSAGRRAAPVRERPKQRGERKGGEKAGVAPTARLPTPPPAWALLCLPEAPVWVAAAPALEGWPGTWTGAGLICALPCSSHRSRLPALGLQF